VESSHVSCQYLGAGPYSARQVGSLAHSALVKDLVQNGFLLESINFVWRLRGNGYQVVILLPDQARMRRAWQLVVVVVVSYANATGLRTCGAVTTVAQIVNATAAVDLLQQILLLLTHQSLRSFFFGLLELVFQGLHSAFTHDLLASA